MKVITLFCRSINEYGINFLFNSSLFRPYSSVNHHTWKRPGYVTFYNMTTILTAVKHPSNFFFILLHLPIILLFVFPDNWIVKFVSFQMKVNLLLGRWFDCLTSFCAYITCLTVHYLSVRCIESNVMQHMMLIPIMWICDQWANEQWIHWYRQRRQFKLDVSSPRHVECHKSRRHSDESSFALYVCFFHLARCVRWGPGTRASQFVIVVVVLIVCVVFADIRCHSNTMHY